MSDRSRFLRAFASSALGTALSRVAGAARDMALSRLLGASASADAFWIAFTVPNVFRRFVADEGLTGALVPAVARAEAEEDEAAARQLADRLLGAMLLANAVLVVVGMLSAEWLVKAFALSFTEDPDKFALTVEMTRWLFPFVAMVSMVSFFEGLLNHRGHFFVPKIAPGLVSGGIVASAWGLASSFEEPAHALVVGVLAGGLVHVLVHIPVLARHWGPLRPALGWSDPRVRAVLHELGKVVAIGVFAQINILVLRQLAAAIGDGAITRFWYANRLVDLSQGIIAVAIGSALLPNISSAIAAQDWDTFRAALVHALRLAAFLLLPAAAVLLLFAEPMTAVLFGGGRYTHADVVATAEAVQLLVPFMLAVAAINLLKKVFFALDDRTTLLWVGGFGVTITAVLGWALVSDYGVTGLAMALSGATAAQLLAYVVLLRRELGARLGFGDLVSPLGRMGLATVPVGGALVLAGGLGDWSAGGSVGNWAIVLGGLGVAAVAYLATAWVLGIEELTTVVGRLRRRVGQGS
jgi:putative peptidoglycan lipid II flippase